MSSLPTIVAGTLASLAVIVYPLGLVAYWIQMWRDYTHDATLALHAASLIPAPVAAGRALDMLPAAITATGFAFSSGAGAGMMGLLKALTEDQLDTPLNRFQRLLFSRIYRTLFAIPPLVTVVLLIAALSSQALAFDVFPLNGQSDVLFFSCAIVGAWGGGLFFMRSYTKRLEVIRNHTNATDIQREFRSIAWQTVATLTLSTVIVAVFFIPVQSPNLANVRFSGDAHGQAKLISHSQGYWYVIKNGDRTVTAIPDSTVGTVTISRP